MSNPGKRHWHHDRKNYSKGRSFGELLEWHLIIWGTNPKSTKEHASKPWTLWNFAAKVHGKWTKDTIEADVEYEKDCLMEWRRGKKHPLNRTVISNILSELFGESKELDDWKTDLEASLNQPPELCPLPPPKMRAGVASHADSADADTAASHAHGAANIPRLARHFIGRDDDLAAILSLFPQVPASTSILIEGGPGMGKTELAKAVALAPDIVNRFGDRRWFVPLQTAKDATQMQDAIIDAVGFDGKLGFGALLDSLRSKQTLLILDNLETPWEPVNGRHEVDALLAELTAVSGVTLLGSFRGFDIVGDLHWERHFVEPMGSHVAIKLFASIAGEWVLNESHLDEFIRELGGIPLAIYLVAIRAYGRTSLAPLWREWKLIGPALARSPYVEEGALTSLNFCIELSLRSQRVDNDSIDILRIVASMPAGLTFDACDELFGKPAFDSIEKLLRTGIAIERSWRIDLLPPIRSHCLIYYPLIEIDIEKWEKFFLSFYDRSKIAIESYKNDGHFSGISELNEFYSYLLYESNNVGYAIDILEKFRCRKNMS